MCSLRVELKRGFAIVFCENGRAEKDVLAPVISFCHVSKTSQVTLILFAVGRSLRFDDDEALTSATLSGQTSGGGRFRSTGGYCLLP